MEYVRRAQRFTAVGAIKAEGQGFTVHGLRKTLNNHLFKNHVDLEVQGPFIGHKIDHVNVGVYTVGNSVEKFSLDDIAKLVTPSQAELLGIIDFD